MPDDPLNMAEPDLASEVESLRLQLELERLDRAWENERQSLLIRGKRGRVFEPSIGLAWWNGGVRVFIGSLFFMGFISLGFKDGGGYYLIFSLFLAGMAILGATYMTRATRKFAEKREVYQTKRAELIARLQ